MILHLTDRLAKKLGETYLAAGRVGRDKFSDWSACLFTADRTQYILFSNTATLYSMVSYGAGVTDGNRLIHDLIDTMRDVTKRDGLEAVYDARIARGFNTFSFTKALEGTVAGGLSELVSVAKLHLASGEISPYDVSFVLNDVPLSYLKGQRPLEAFCRISKKPILVRSS
jgi:hypothetical protein